MLVAALLPFLASLALALPSSPPSPARRTHERRAVPPSSWSAHPTPPHPLTPIPLRFALTQSNLEAAHSALLAVSDPHSSAFGQHWSAKAVAEFFAPSDASLAAVLSWLESEGVPRSRVQQSQSLGWLAVQGATVGEAERLLNTTYSVYAHDATGAPHLACSEYSLPEHVAPHVDFVYPTLHFDPKIVGPKEEEGDGKWFGNLKRQYAPDVGKSIGSPYGGSLPKSAGRLSKIWNELEMCDQQIVPICLQALYKLPFGLQFATKKNSLGIVEYTPQSYLPGDLDMFFKMYLPQAVGERPKLDSIDGGALQSTNQSFNFNGESDLDLEYSMALVYPLVPTLYQTGDFEMGASFNNFLDAIDGSYCTYMGGDDPTQDGIYPDNFTGGYTGPENCGGFAATKVISTSYAYNEADLTPFYEMRQCNEYLKLGLQGVTVLYSSGDYGVAGNGGQCILPNGTYSVNGTMFNPSFPGTCPYITSVGATQIKPNASVFAPEEACETVIYSGGGFSNVFALPSYQESAVKSFFAHHPPPYTAAQYNNSQLSRGFPDISANGANYVIAVDGNFSLVFGTSASTPVVASIIALVNDARLAVGKKTVGFLNPVLYKNPWLLNDITSGGNQGCHTPGFTATEGWDPVTGLGTPDYVKLTGYYLTLP